MINTDKNPAYGEALRQLKRDDPDIETIERRQAKYLNNRIEADHGPIKRLCRATLGFRSMKTAYNTISTHSSRHLGRWGMLNAEGSFEPAFEKIALYAQRIPGIGWEPTHAARQLSDGCWTSKLGTLEDIEHFGVDAVADGIHGTVVRYLRRDVQSSGH